MSLEVTSQINEALLPLAIALCIIETLLKATPRLPSWCIPWILFFLSQLAANLLLGWSVSSAIQGVIACGMAVLGEELYKQAQVGIHDSIERHSKKHKD